MTDTEKIYDSMTTEELERALPLYVQKNVPVECPCLRCVQDRSKCVEPRAYVQEICRNGEGTRRMYAISYHWDWNRNTVLFRTGRYFSFRGALIEAHKTLAGMGLHPYAPEEVTNAAE
jgi:hypothetical protein